jgi:hypothetical protein
VAIILCVKQRVVLTVHTKGPLEADSRALEPHIGGEFSCVTFGAGLSSADDHTSTRATAHTLLDLVRRGSQLDTHQLLVVLLQALANPRTLALSLVTEKYATKKRQDLATKEDRMSSLETLRK